VGRAFLIVGGPPSAEKRNRSASKASRFAMNSPLAFVEWDWVAGRLTSPEAEQAFGWSADEVLDRHPSIGPQQRYMPSEGCPRGSGPRWRDHRDALEPPCRLNVPASGTTHAGKGMKRVRFLLFYLALMSPNARKRELVD